MKNKAIYIRSLVLFSAPLLACLLLYSFGQATKDLKLQVFTDENTSSSAITEKKDVSPDFLNYLPDPLTLALFLVNVDVYAENEVRVLGTNSISEPTFLNIDVGGKYTGGISSGEKIKVYEGMSLQDLLSVKITRSFSVKDENRLLTPNSFYRLPVVPHKSAYLLVFFFVLIVWSGLILLFYETVRFLKKGSSF